MALVLFALLWVKVSAFHVYAHQDDATNEIENCKVCHLMVESQSVEEQIAPAPSFDTPHIEIISRASIFENKIVVVSPLLHARLFGRPPPSLG